METISKKRKQRACVLKESTIRLEKGIAQGSGACVELREMLWKKDIKAKQLIFEMLFEEKF